MNLKMQSAKLSLKTYKENNFHALLKYHVVQVLVNTYEVPSI